MELRRIEGALRLLDQLEGLHAFEYGLIDSSDWDQFSAYDLLRVADGQTTIHNLVWGIGDQPATPEEALELERRKLRKWEADAQPTQATAEGEGA